MERNEQAIKRGLKSAMVWASGKVVWPFNVMSWLSWLERECGMDPNDPRAQAVRDALAANMHRVYGKAKKGKR